MFSSFFNKKSESLKAPTTAVDACYKDDDGNLSNRIICEDMLEGVSQSKEVKDYLISKAKEMGFTDELATKYWG